MAILSLRSRKRFLEIAISATICVSAFLMQMLALNYLGIHGINCNLPLTLTIVWGLVFGSSLQNMTALDLRRRSASEIFSRQLSAGSHSAFLIGWFYSWLYEFMMPVYPINFPLIGWASGYFCLRGIGQGNLLCIPMTFILTLVAEAIMSWELIIFGHSTDFTHPGMWLNAEWTKIIFDHLGNLILPEALLNSIIAPFIYFPMRRWYDMVEGQQSSFPID